MKKQRYAAEKNHSEKDVLLKGFWSVVVGLALLALIALVLWSGVLESNAWKDFLAILFIFFVTLLLGGLGIIFVTVGLFMLWRIRRDKIDAGKENISFPKA